MNTPSTCGAGLAAFASTTQALAGLMAAVANVLEVHLSALDPTDSTTTEEQDAYSQLVGEHRTIGAALLVTARHMESYRDLPMGRHNLEQLGGPQAVEAFHKFIIAEQRLVAVLQQHLEQDLQMMQQMTSN